MNRFLKALIKTVGVFIAIFLFTVGFALFCSLPMVYTVSTILTLMFIGIFLAFYYD